MQRTKLNTIYIRTIKILKKYKNTSVNYFSINLISLLIGFFTANALATLPGQTGDWAIVVSAMSVSISEILSKLIYSIKLKSRNSMVIFTIINNIKLGVIYGFFVDSFKLGS